ncbi:hypothetical protein [Alteribacter keqinensis]|uniref:Uncharacterized protein n=1 Tax=Alteribacter keqinensis TaxID=2483800 RepID=A0A3M7TWU8_9BACI|nr:hypothetical protein [Alteribacter keqinensis]RNA69749.1 hypothetical protein EBO34_07375 [Alteribacter keqinensis]
MTNLSINGKTITIFGFILLLAITFTYALTIHFAYADSTETAATTYPDKIMEQVRQSLGERKHSTNLDEEIMALPKAEVMDLYFDAHGRTKGFGPEMREVVLMIFGVNLDAISSMEKLGVSIFSKGLWITQQPHDLFVLHSGNNDVDVMIYPTDYFKEETGLDGLPEKLTDRLKELGFIYNEDLEAYYYEHPDGIPIPDEEKHPIMGAILKTIEEDYSHLLY